MDRPVQIDSGLFLVGRAHTDRCRNWNGLFRPSDAHHNHCEFFIASNLEDEFDASTETWGWWLIKRSATLRPFWKKGVGTWTGVHSGMNHLVRRQQWDIERGIIKVFLVGGHYEQWVCTSGSDSSFQSSLGCFQPFVVCGKGVRLSRWQESTPTPESSLDFHFSKKGGSRVSLWSTHPHQPSIIVTFMLFWKTLSYLARSHHVI